MMRPQPFACMAGASARISASGASRLSASVARMSFAQLRQRFADVVRRRVDEDIRCPKRGVDLPDRAKPLIRRAEVGRDRHCVDTVGTEFPYCALERINAARHKYQLRALRAHCIDHRTTDAGTAAGNDGNPAIEAEERASDFMCAA